MDDKKPCLIGRYSTIKKKEIDWLWHPYVPFGKITLIQGDPGAGKSTLALTLASIASRAGTMPDGSRLDAPANVICQCLEDGMADTILPRLEKAGARVKRFFYVGEDEIPARHANRETIERVISETGARLMIIDPIQAMLGRSFGGENVAARKFMDELAAVADQTGCAVILIGHLNKNESGKDLYRGLGSIDFVAAARSVLRVDGIREGSPVRVIRHVKSSLSREGDDFAFEIDSDGKITWIGMINTACEGGEVADQTETAGSKKHDRIQARLEKLLRGEDLPYSEIIEQTKGMGGVRTLKDAKRELGIKSVKKADGWYWHLPGKEDA